MDIWGTVAGDAVVRRSPLFAFGKRVEDPMLFGKKGIEHVSRYVRFLCSEF
jgi:hypothetical protein